MNKKAIVTLVFGDEYKKLWSTWVKPTWEAYAAKYGYDIIVLDKAPRPDLLSEHRPIAWQKLFILKEPNISKYERVLWLDADVLINHHKAPCIVESMKNPAKIGMIDLQDFFTTRFEYDNTVRYWLGNAIREFEGKVLKNELDPAITNFTADDLLRLLDRDFEKTDFSKPAYNTGVMVLSPKHHADFFEGIYHKYIDEPNTRQWEQPAIVKETNETYMGEKLDPLFNTIAIFEVGKHYLYVFSDIFTSSEKERLLLNIFTFTTLFQNCYFLHFAENHADLIPFVASETQDTLSLFRILWNYKVKR